jgi:hypothetical protein
MNVTRIELRFSLVISLDVLVLAPSGALAESFRPAEGMEVHFIVPEGTPITAADPAAGEEGDMILFTGKSTGVFEIGNCWEGWSSGHAQSATAVDPGEHRATSLLVTRRERRLHPARSTCAWTNPEASQCGIRLWNWTESGSRVNVA